jgi:hypothetical protein
MDTYHSSNTNTNSIQQGTSQRIISDYTDQFVCDDAAMLRNKLSEKNLLPDTTKQSKPAMHRANFGHNRNMLY